MKVFDYDQVDWAELFAPQIGGSRFKGYPYQRGGSLSGFLRAAMRIVPMLPGVIKSPIGDEAIKRTINVVQDIRHGAEPLTAIKNRGRQAVKNLTGVGQVSRIKKPRKKSPLFVPAL